MYDAMNYGWMKSVDEIWSLVDECFASVELITW